MSLNISLSEIASTDAYKLSLCQVTDCTLNPLEEQTVMIRFTYFTMPL